MHAGKASSSFETVREIQQRMQRAHVSPADEARRHADPAPDSGDPRLGGSPALNGQQLPAHPHGHASAAPQAQNHEDRNGAETGDKPQIMRADNTGVLSQ